MSCLFYGVQYVNGTELFITSIIKHVKQIFQTARNMWRSLPIFYIVPQSLENHARSLFENIYFTEREESTANGQESHLLKLLYTFLQIGKYKFFYTKGLFRAVLRIRDPVPFWTLDPESGMKNPDR